MPKAFDLTGRRFGRLVVSSRAENLRCGITQWNCVCDCGKDVLTRGAYLVNKKVSSCGCYKRDRMRKDPMKMVGQRFGKLVVVGPAKIEDRSPLGLNSIERVGCACDCGKFKMMEPRLLRNGGSRSCGCGVKDAAKRRMEPDRWLADKRRAFSFYASNAKKDDRRQLSIDRDRFIELVSGNCHYCGTDASYDERGGKRPLGLDRKDNDRPYEEDNIVPCCADCNYAKGDRSYNSFTAWIARLLTHNVPSIWTGPLVLGAGSEDSDGVN